MEFCSSETLACKEEMGSSRRAAAKRDDVIGSAVADMAMVEVEGLEWVAGNCGVEYLFEGSESGVGKLVGWVMRVGKGDRVAKEAFGGVVQEKVSLVVKYGLRKAEGGDAFGGGVLDECLNCWSMLASGHFVAQTSDVYCVVHFTFSMSI